MSKKSCLLISLVLVFGFFSVHSAYGQWGPPEQGDVWWVDQAEDPNNHLWNGPNNWAYWDDGIGDVVLGNEPNLSNMVFIGKGVLEKPWPPTLFEYIDEESPLIEKTPVIDSNVAAKCYALWGPGGSWEGEGWYWYLNILGGSLTIGNMSAPEYSTRWEIAGTDGSGDVNMVGGVVNVAGDMTIANWGGLGDVNMTGGEINVKFALCMPGVDSGDGENNEAEGTLKLKGGTIRCGGLYLNEWATFSDDYNWSSEWMSTSTREPITGSSESTIDLSGGTLIIDGSYGNHIARFVTNGYMTVYGVEEGDIAPDDRRAYVNVDYDTVEDTTTVTAATADPEQAYNPRPAHYSEDQPINVNLRWSAGDGATSHDVYLGTSFEDVNEADTSDLSGIYRDTRPLTSYDPPEFLKIQTTYYWRIDEFDGATTWKGRVWCFTVANYRVVDDFDSYSNDSALYNVWKDYWANGTGAEIYLQRDQDFEPDGHEMEYRYDNVDEDLGSEAEASIDDLGIDKDWTTSGATKSLVLYFYGDRSDNSVTENDRMYVAVEDADGNVGTVPYDGDANDVKKQEWHEWNVDLQLFTDQSVDLTDVAKLYIGFGGPRVGQTAAGGDGTVYFNNIKLYPSRCLPEKVQTDFTGDCIVGMEDLDLMAGDWLLSDSSVTVVPPAFAPQLWYRFDEGTGTIIHNDGNLPGLDGNFLGPYPAWVTPGAPAVDACDPNFAMYFDGSNDYVEIDYSPELELNDFTVSAWVNIATEPSGDGAGVLGTRVGGDNTFDLKVQENKIHGDIGDGTEWINIYIDIRAGDTGSNGQGGDLDLGTWYMITYVIDNTNQEVRLYLDGDLKRTIAISGTPLLMKSGQSMWIGQTGYTGEVMDGLIDDVRVYSQTLSQEEILYLTGAEGTIFLAVPSPANITDPEPPLSRKVNFADYAVMADHWLEEILWP